MKAYDDGKQISVSFVPDRGWMQSVVIGQGYPLWACWDEKTAAGERTVAAPIIGWLLDGRPMLALPGGAAPAGHDRVLRYTSSDPALGWRRTRTLGESL